MSVAFTDWPPFRQHTLELIETSLRNGKLVDGPNTAALEAAWKEETGAAYVLACSSGTAALYRRWQVAAMPDHTAFHDPNAEVPEARAMLEDSFLVFTERWPLHAQSEEVVHGFAETIQRVWSR
jgi:hypothetical protein